MHKRGLGPGDWLGREEDLAHEFGVSRPTLREALRLLSGLHLIRASKGPGGGIFVAATAEEGIGRNLNESIADMIHTNSVELDELLETRLLLEVPLAGLAAQRATDEDIAELRALLNRAPDETGLDALTTADGHLHRSLARIAGNRLAAALTEWVVEVLQDPLAEFIQPALVEAVIADHHRDLVRALELGDPTAAEVAMREHLVYLRDLVAAVDRANKRK